jgi:hypothetical protein
MRKTYQEIVMKDVEKHSRLVKKGLWQTLTGIVIGTTALSFLIVHEPQPENSFLMEPLSYILDNPGYTMKSALMYLGSGIIWNGFSNVREGAENLEHYARGSLNEQNEVGKN